MTQFLPTDALPSRNPQLLDQVREVVLVPLADAFLDVQDVLAESLFRLAADAGPAQNDFMEAIKALRQQREPITARFRGHLAQAWQGLESGRPLSADRTLARGGAGLSLLPEHDLEVRLAVRNLAGALQHQWRPELMRLNRYLGFIAGGLRIDGDSNPFGPEHLGVALYEAFQGVSLAPKVHLAVIKLCEQQLMDRVGTRYSELEQALAQVARLRDLPKARSRRRGIPRQGEAVGEDSGDAPDWIARFFADWSGGQECAGRSGGHRRASAHRPRRAAGRAASVAAACPPATRAGPGNCLHRATVAVAARSGLGPVIAADHAQGRL